MNRIPSLQLSSSQSDRRPYSSSKFFILHCGKICFFLTSERYGSSLVEALCNIKCAFLLYLLVKSSRAKIFVVTSNIRIQYAVSQYEFLTRLCMSEFEKRSYQNQWYVHENSCQLASTINVYKNRVSVLRYHLNNWGQKTWYAFLPD